MCCGPGTKEATKLEETAEAYPLQQPLLLSPGKVAQLAVRISGIPQRIPLGLSTSHGSLVKRGIYQPKLSKTIVLSKGLNQPRPCCPITDLSLRYHDVCSG